MVAQKIFVWQGYYETSLFLSMYIANISAHKVTTGLNIIKLMLKDFSFFLTGKKNFMQCFMQFKMRYVHYFH